MSKELVAIAALSLSLIAAVFGFGMRIGTLSERVAVQTQQIELLSAELRAINAHFIVWAGTHTAPPTRR
jgi:hypothetical protein